MLWSSFAVSRKPRLSHGTTPLARVTGRMVLELGCWIAGIVLVLAYLTISHGLEDQRKQGIELFTEARAEVQSHRLEDLPLPTQIMAVQDGQTPDPTPATPITTNAESLPIAVLRMARVGLEVPVYPDVSELNLNRGAGWIEGTAAPNTGGNMAVAAHRDQYFRPLKDVEVGDIVELESLSGYGEFRVSSIVIVDPDEVSVLDDTAVPTITLVTCYPFYFIGNAPQRYVVQATAVEKSGKASDSDAILTALPSGETP